MKIIITIAIAWIKEESKEENYKFVSNWKLRRVISHQLPVIGYQEGLIRDSRIVIRDSRFGNRD